MEEAGRERGKNSPGRVCESDLVSSRLPARKATQTVTALRYDSAVIEVRSFISAIHGRHRY